MSGVLYYSPNCQKCTELLNKYNVNNMKLINVHTSHIPKYITGVPTIIIGTNMYVGNNADLYLQDNSHIESFEFSTNSQKNTGGFSFIDDNTCKYSEQKNFSEI